MNPITVTAQAFDAIQGAKAGAPAFCTNFFPTQGKLQGWIDHGELRGEIRGRSAFFLRKDRDFWHLFFCAADVATLQREITALPCLRTERVAVDLVGSEAVVGGMLNVAEGAGFRRYARLLRLARASQSGQPQPSADGVTVLRNAAQEPEIDDLLRQLNDVGKKSGLEIVSQPQFLRHCSARFRPL